MVSHAYVSIVFGFFQSKSICGSNFVYRGTQNLFVDAATGSDATRGLIGSFLNQIAVVPFCPLPLHFVPRRRFIESGPPLVIRLATEPSAHCFDDITRIGEEMHATGFAQRFQPQSRGYYFRLLIGCVAKIFTYCAPQTFVPKEGH